MLDFMMGTSVKVGVGRGEKIVATYSVYFFCDECSEFHPLSMTVSLDDGPAEKASISDTYSGKELNPIIANLINNKITCPNTGKITFQKDNNQIFLVPVGD